MKTMLDHRKIIAKLIMPTTTTITLTAATTTTEATATTVEKDAALPMQKRKKQ